MLYLWLFILGILTDRYIFPILDYALGWISNKYTLHTNYVQAEIDQINKPIEPNVIGFQIPSEYEYEDCEEENKIGFIKK